MRRLAALEVMTGETYDDAAGYYVPGDPIKDTKAQAGAGSADVAILPIRATDGLAVPASTGFTHVVHDDADGAALALTPAMTVIDVDGTSRQFDAIRRANDAICSALRGPCKRRN